MGALVAAVNKEGKSSVSTVIIMLRELTHRGVDGYGVATPDSVVIGESIEETPIEEIGSAIVLGHSPSRFYCGDEPQLMQGEDFTLAFEGRLFPQPSLSEIHEATKMLEANPHRNARKVIEKLNGSYTFAIACADTLIVGRDPLGLCPLYYGENETTLVFASERKALWAVRVRSAEPFPPGKVAVVNQKSLSFEPARTLTKPPLETMDMETASSGLRNLLQKSTKNRVSDLDRVAVAFSGGLDSSVITALAKSCGVEVHLFSVALENQPEVRFAKAAAGALGSPLHLQTYTIDDVELILPKVLWLIEEPNVMKVGTAIPLYWAAENASKLGFNVLLSGLGGDELFAGYQKYLKEYKRCGATAVRNALFHDVKMSYETNFQRDNKVCSFHKVELRLPFIDQDLVNLALSLPANLNILSAEDHLRKRVLRQTAQKLGVPSFIVNKTKKAIQYATGVNKAIRRLAKERGLSPRDYVEEIFKKVFPGVDM